ncbi:MAG: Exported zinc metalloprotease YfgC precursor [uncultured Thiotrichaceae bacterium]|uniref:Exported zinc metalloprotease YfgC n=1 Tax=uncultured Thiotrichaceae bacterium TaxID=298394 RepID=A0A6S6U4L4_9GAMM|nr:MAG: Exported zinc metalloprotease YfgC precursor [uncultured Thiotrichaceae bacterium]
MKALHIAVSAFLLSSLLLPSHLLAEGNLFNQQTQGSLATGNIDSPAIGRQLFRTIRRSSSLIEDPELTGWISQLVNRLAVHAPGVSKTPYVAITRDPSVNAYALTGGIIIVHSGLILSTQTESELAAVLAHELAHLSQRHLTRMINDRKNSPLITGLGILASAAIASKSSEAAQAILSGTMAIQAQQQVSYSQHYESEADRVGLRILTAAHFNPQGMPSFLEKLDKGETNAYGNLSKYLRSHPLSIDRLSDTRSRAGNIKTPVQESVDYLFAREKIRAIYQSGQNTGTPGIPAEVASYQQALQQFRRNNYNGVLKVLGTRSARLPVALLIAQSLNATRRFAEAERMLTPLQRQHPQNAALTLILAQAVAGKGDRHYAWQLLNRLRPTANTGLEYFESAQHIAQQAGQYQEAVLYNAERNLRTGEYKYAQLALEQVLRGNNPEHVKAKLQRKLNEVKMAKNELNYLKK